MSRKLKKLNITLMEGNTARGADTHELLKDQFIKIPLTHRWYHVHVDKTEFSRSKVSYWGKEPQSLTVPSPDLSNVI